MGWGMPGAPDPQTRRVSVMPSLLVDRALKSNSRLARLSDYSGLLRLSKRWPLLQRVTAQHQSRFGLTHSVTHSD